MKLIIAISLALAPIVGQAKTLNLVAEKSTIKYLAKVFIKGDVKGELNQGKSTLSGTLSGDDEANGADAVGSVRIVNPYFKTDEEQRDIHVAEMMVGDIVVAFDGKLNQIAKDNARYLVPVKLTWNNVTEAETASAAVTKEGDTVKVQFAMMVNRKKYGVAPKKGHQLLDPALEAEVKIAGTLIFQ